MVTPTQADCYILRRKQVQVRTGLSRSSIYAAIKAGTFPAPISLGERAVGWTVTSINGWIESRVHASRDRAARGGGSPFGENPDIRTILNGEVL
jgi:prophage regulatory protein